MWREAVSRGAEQRRLLEHRGAVWRGMACRGRAEVQSGGGRWRGAVSCGAVRSGGGQWCGGGRKENLKMLQKPIENFQKMSKIITCDFYQFTEVFDDEFFQTEAF